MLRTLACLVAALCLSACASSYVGKPYDRASAGVRTIAVVDDPTPDKAMAFEAASIGSNFGLVGALVNAGIQASRENAIKEALEGVKFNAEDRLEARIAAKLAAEGYTVRPLNNGVRPKRAFLATYPAAPGGTDAYLDVNVISYGYLSAGAFQPFRPHANAIVRLVSAKDPSKTLMENQIVYNGMYVQKGVITLTPNESYAFKNRAELLADPNRLAAGIEDALNQVADTAAQLLR